MKLDAADLRILKEIQNDGRITKLALAERVGLSPTPCWNRLKKLEDSGIVMGYRTRIRMRAIAPIAEVLVEVTLGNHRQADFDRFERAIREAPEVVSCWSVGGGVDYILKVVSPGIDHYQRLVDGWLAREIGIARYFTYIVTRTVKEEIDAPVELLALRPSKE